MPLFIYAQQTHITFYSGKIFWFVTCYINTEIKHERSEHGTQCVHQRSKLGHTVWLRVTRVIQEGAITNIKRGEKKPNQKILLEGISWPGSLFPLHGRLWATSSFPLEKSSFGPQIIESEWSGLMLLKLQVCFYCRVWSENCAISKSVKGLNRQVPPLVTSWLSLRFHR